jgi:5'-3' exonuclease
MQVYLVDGTYELFRHYYAAPSARDADGREVGALRAVLYSILGLIERGATHVGVATDHVIESFRNDLWRGYKTGAGIDPALLSQFHPLEDALTAMGVKVWAMVEQEADDALAAAAVRAAADPRVTQVLICTPDKDLAQVVSGNRIVQFDRRKREIRTEEEIVQKYGVRPGSIPDYLALVGDSADGFPGLPGWGARSAAGILSRFGHLEQIPDDWRDWHADVRNAATLARTLADHRELVYLFRDLATLRTDASVFESVDELKWTGPTEAFAPLMARLDAAVTAPSAQPSRR